MGNIRRRAKVIRRRKEELRLLKQGKTTKEIASALGVGGGLVRDDYNALLRNLRPENIERFRAIKRGAARSKFSLSKAMEIISASKNVIKGHASMLPKKPWRLPLPLRKNPKKEAQVLHELRSTKKSLTQIAGDNQASWKVVQKAYNFLKAKGEEIPVRARTYHGLMGKATGQLSRAKIAALMIEHEPAIVRKAGSFYRHYRDLFNTAGFDEKDIAGYIRRQLPHKLELFNPDSVKKVSGFENKARFVCSRQIRFLAIDMLKIARKKAGKELGSLEKPLVIARNSIGEKAFTRRGILAGQIRMENPEEAIALLEETAKKAGFTIQQKAVAYARFAGFTSKQIGDMGGLGSSYAWVISMEIRKKMRKAGLAPPEKKRS